jgi:hypothetical protein
VVNRVLVRQALNGAARSSGSTELHSLVMFVVHATRPFSSPAKFGH